MNHRNMDGTKNIIMCGNGGGVVIGGDTTPPQKLHVLGGISSTEKISESLKKKRENYYQKNYKLFTI